MNKEKNFVSVVVYVHNNEEGVQKFLTEITAYIKNLFEHYEIICVDDGSTDNTVQAIKYYVSKNGEAVTVIEMGFHQGLELAMNAGVDLSIGDFVFEFDFVDISYELDEIYTIYKLCLEGNDIVAACPEKNRNICSKIFYSLFNVVSKTSYKLQTDLFRILSRRAINRIRSMSNVLPYRKAVYANCGLTMKNHIFKSKLDFSKTKNDRKASYRLGLAVDTFILYTNVAYKLASFFSIFMLIVSALISLYAVTIRIRGIPVEGWTSMVLVMCFGFFGLSFLITILIKYTELILKTVFAHQKYIVQSVERMKG